VTPVRWTPEAADDLASLVEYIREDRPEAARGVARRILSSIEDLGRFSQLGRPGRVANTRELSVPGLPYIVVYRLRTEAVQILHVHHTARDRSEPPTPGT